MISFTFARDDETASLLRQATAFADSKLWDEAIDALYSANKRMCTSPVSYPIETWLKLPLYLQRAGRFDESMRVFDQIDTETPVRVARFLGHASAQERRQSTIRQRAVIREKRMLAVTRESAAAAKRRITE